MVYLPVFVCLLILAACGSDVEEPGNEPPSVPAASVGATNSSSVSTSSVWTSTPVPVTTSAEPSSGVVATAAPSLPSRAEMQEWERAIGEITFVRGVRAENIGELYTDDELIAGGNAACDALDGGKPLRGVLVQVAEALPRLESTDAVATLAGAATGAICPEHRR